MSPLKGQRLKPPEEKLDIVFTIRLTKEEVKQLKRVAKRRKIPAAFVAREGIALVLEKYKE